LGAGGGEGPCQPVRLESESLRRFQHPGPALSADRVVGPRDDPGGGGG
jgi:hypothetical protein